MTSEAPGIPCIQPGSDASNVESNARFDEDTNENNVCVQTGEEFSTEFIRDRFARRVTVLPDGNKLQPTRVGFNLTPTRQLVCEDFTGTIGLRSSDVLDFVPRIGSSIEMENKALPDGIRKCQWEYGNGQGSKFSDEINSDLGTPVSISSPIYVVESVRSYHPFDPGARGAAAFSTKMKLLCSFGGKILPRPVDGKLRYVGGMTRIISVRKNSCWEELMKKTSAICSLPHIIKYQLPGEDLDALVSVCSDEDLHHMIEEYEDLERNGRCHRLRIFLVSLGEPDSPNSFEAMAGQHSDPGSQYVAAVNATVDMSPQKGSGGQNLGSQTFQLGNISDYSPMYHVHSPKSTHALENKDSVPISSNLAGMVSNTAAQFLTPLRIPTKSSYLSLSLSPSQVQHIDDQFFDGNESNSSCAMDKSLGGKPYYMNVNAYLNQLPLGSPPLMSYNHHQYLVETTQNNRPFKVNCHNHSPTRDLTPSPRGHGDISSERSGIKERAFRSELSLSHPEYPVGFLSGSNGEVGLQYKMVHALSDSQLHGLDDRSHHCLEEGIISQLYTVRENSPSQVNLNSSQEQRQCQEIVNVKHQSDKYENQCSPVTPMWLKEKHVLGQNMSDFNDRRLEQGRNHSEGIIKTILSDAALKCNNFPNINYTANASIFPQDIQDNVVVTSSSSVICLEKPADIIREHPESYQLDTSEPELFLMSQRTTKKPICSGSEKIDDQPYSYGSPGLQAIACQGSADQESIVLNSKFHTSAGSGRGRFLHEKESLNNPDQKVEKVGPRKQSYRELKVENYVCVQSHPSDISDDRSPGITASSRIDPCVMDETSEGFSSPRETDAEIIPPESYNEDAKGDGKDLDGSINEASVADTEAGIDGLQIINNSDLEELQELGSGTYGTVYHGKWRGTDVAIKRIKKSCFAGGSSEQERLTKDYWREARILSNLHHPNVVAFYGIVPEGPGVSLATVTEYMVNGSLRQVLQKKGRALDLRKRLILALDAAFGMEYLHLKNIVHFDLKCDNFLVNLRDPLRPICKVGDFGLSKIKHKTLVSGGVRGTLPWMAPELLNGGSSRVSEKVDVYSFGMALWEILTGDEPYANMHCGAIIGGIVNNTLRPPIPERCDPEWRKLMEECWSPDPAARPSFTDITIRLRSMLDALQTKRAHFSNR